MVVISMCMSDGSSGEHAVHDNNLRLLNHIYLHVSKLSYIMLNL